MGSTQPDNKNFGTDPKRRPLIEIAFVFFCIFLLLRFGTPFSVNNITTTKADLFTATGTGEVRARPTKATFSVGVTKTAMTADEAKNQMNQVLNKILADLKRLGVSDKDIQTTNVSVYPNQNATPLDSTGSLPVRQSSGGFTAQADLNITVNSVDLANQALDLTTSDGANQVSGVNFKFDDAKQELLYDQARIKAIADAKKKAQKLASQAGITLGRLVNIQESDNGTKRMFTAESTQAKLNDKTNLQPGQNTITVQITLYYETK